MSQQVTAQQAGKIEIEKLKAIGVRNAVATLEEVSLRVCRDTRTAQMLSLHGAS